MPPNPILWSLDDRGIARVALNRPEVGNAYDGALIAALSAALTALPTSPPPRALLLKGNGRHFQAGADLKWVSALAEGTLEENLSASRATAEAVDRLNRLPIPTVALVQGGCFGGGTGLIAACDIVIAAEDAIFSIAEVRWGLTAAIIIPQLSDAISVRQLRRYALTGERFGAADALRTGLVHKLVARADLEAAGEEMLAHLLGNGPAAMAETKALALESAWGGFDPPTLAALVHAHALKRRSAEAREGLRSFLQKRPANWPPPAELGEPRS
jgi:methylglutaconyl-CoA hydratase